jgi:hypothetical protein
MKKLFLTLPLALMFSLVPLAASAQSSTCSGPGDTSCGTGYVCQKASDGTYACFISSVAGNPATFGNGAGNSSTFGNSSTGNPASFGNSGGSGGLQNPLGFSTIPQFLTAILGLMVTVGSVVIVIMIVYVGFLFVTAQGAEEKIKEARQALLWTVIGALILLGAQAISTGIQATVNALGS